MTGSLIFYPPALEYFSIANFHKVRENIKKVIEISKGKKTSHPKSFPKITFAGKYAIKEIGF